MTLESAVAWLRELPPWTVYTVVFLAGFGEYVLPVIPGDTLVVASAVLVTAFGWSVPAMFTVVVASNVAGAYATYKLGEKLRATGRLETLTPPRRRALAAVLALVERYGLVVIALNRFFPGIRSAFFVAAGSAGLPLGRVLALAGLGGALWNAVLVGIGVAAGRNIAAVESAVSRLGLALVVLVVSLVAGLLWVVRRALRDEPSADQGAR